MSILTTPKAPKGFDMLQFPTRGGKSAGIYDQLGGDFLQQLLSRAQGNDQSFQPQEQQAQNFYQQQLAPQIAQRYAGSGIGGSSGMQNALASGASNLTTDLQSQRNDLMHQSMQDVMHLGNLLLSHPDMENYFMPKKEKKPWWHQALGIGLPAIGTAAGAFFGGPMGASMGASLGSSLASGFTNR